MANDILIGWLAPNGIFYGCGFMEHTDKAEQLVKHYYGKEIYSKPEEYLFSNGFLKFTRNDCFLFCEDKQKTITNKQAEFIKERELTSGQERGLTWILDCGEHLHATCGDENLKPFEIPRVVHAMDEYPESTKYIKIIANVPVSKEYKPEIGKIYPVIKEGGEYAYLYFILVNGEEVGIYPVRECELVKEDEVDENKENERLSIWISKARQENSHKKPDLNDDVVVVAINEFFELKKSGYNHNSLPSVWSIELAIKALESVKIEDRLIDIIISNFHSCPIPEEDYNCKLGFQKEGCKECFLNYIRKEEKENGR